MHRKTKYVLAYGGLGLLLPWIIPSLPLIGGYWTNTIFLPMSAYFSRTFGWSSDAATTVLQMVLVLISVGVGVNAGVEEAAKPKTPPSPEQPGPGTPAEVGSAPASDPVSAPVIREVTQPLPVASTSALTSAPVAQASRVDVSAPAKPGSGRLIVYRVLQVLMGLWTLLCLAMAFSGINDASEGVLSSDPATSTGASLGVAAGLVVLGIVWLVPLIGLGVIAYFVRPRPVPVQVVYLSAPQDQGSGRPAGD